MKIKNILVPLSALAMIVLVLIYSGVLSSFQVSKSSVVGASIGEDCVSMRRPKFN